MSIDEKDNSNSEFNEDSLREIAKEIVVKRTALKIHSILYCSVNILLVIIGILAGEHNFWFFWPITGWGMALIFHTFWYITFKNGSFDTGSEAAIAWHATISIVVSVFLFFIDWFTDPETVLALKRPEGWSIYPIVALLGTVVIHLMIYLFRRPRKGENPKKSYIDRKVDKELEKINKKKGGA